jgi:phosphatidylglycerol:prolipoprotein diacylglycerol transferase
MFAVWKGGLSFHGGIIAGLLATYFFFQNKGVPFIEVMDAFAPGVSLGIILVRIGNFMNGDILGYKWDGPWAMNFPNDAYHLNNAGAIILRHPTEIYGMLVGLICLLISMVVWIETYETHRFPPGANYLGFVLSYSLVRSLIEEPFRDVPLPWKVVDPATHGYGLFTTTQLASVVLILVAIWGMTQLRKWERLRAEAAKRTPRGGGSSGGSGTGGGRPVSSVASVARPGQTRQARRALEREQQKKIK